MNINIEDVVQAFDDELNNWDFFSDPQRIHIREDGRIWACLRNYNWYVTKEPIKNPMDAIRALFEIMWISEYEAEERGHWIDGSKFWEKD